jgi:succinoglycan biosynthesis transport protein ExoP
VPETQLLKVTAEDPDPAQAKSIADTYAAVFTDYARNNLSDTTKATITLADAAPLPKTPARPRPTLYTLIAAVLALALGTGLAFLRERLDRRLRTQEDVEASFDKPVLARVPRRGRSDASITAFKEAHRILRTNLQFAAGGSKIKSVAITSGREGEGKTTSAANLAVASAEVGLNVLVVEADFRRPALQRELMPNRPDPLRPGFSNYLVEAATLDEIIYPTGRPNISIVPSGPLPPTPSALLESRRGREAAAELTQEADLVIVDCPPLSIGADASVVAGWVDGVVVVLDLSTSTDQSVRSALRQLDAVHAPLLGLLLNRDRTATPSSYDYYSSIDTEAQQKLRRGVSSR